MCGIAGAVSPEAIDPERVVRMRDELAHRGPDAAGLWRSPDGRVCLGHRRLAVIDVGLEANQPFLSSDGRFVVAANAEIYNYRALRAELERAGRRFRTASDTEVLVEAYAAYGEDVVDRLSGMFAFAAWDTQEQTLFCARDRAGEKPFHYVEAGGAFLFGSELKALLRWPGLRRAIDYEALAEFFVLGCCVDPRTVWRGVRKLEPGHTLTVRLGPGGVEAGPPRRYWDLSFRPDDSVADWRPLVIETLERATAELAVADVPVGAFLSGGVDSSAVTAALARTGRPLQTFAIGFEEEDFDERRWAALVARTYGTGHAERVLRAADVAAVFPEPLVWHFDEPFNDHSYVPTHAVSALARESVTVALSGDGGDELFAGYSRYGPLAAYASAHGSAPDYSWAGLAAGGRRAAGARLALAAAARRRLRRRGPSAHAQGGPALALLGANATCIPEPVLRDVARGPLAEALASFSPADTVRAMLRRADPAEVGLVNARRYVDLKLTLGADLLVKIDRASMAVALEVRPVFLHRDFLELAGRIPAPLLADGAETKKILKAALEPWLPADLLHRPKAGFSMPFGAWLTGGLAGLLAGLTREGRPLAGLISPSFVAEEVRRHRAGTSPYASTTLHGLVFLDHWLERWA